MSHHDNKNFFAVFGLLFGAFCWGIIWYPYRIMADAGVSGVVSSFYTYLIRYWLDCILRDTGAVYLNCLSVLWG